MSVYLHVAGTHGGQKMVFLRLTEAIMCHIVRNFWGWSRQVRPGPKQKPQKELFTEIICNIHTKIKIFFLVLFRKLIEP